jgi:hypothetical protein
MPQALCSNLRLRNSKNPIQPLEPSHGVMALEAMKSKCQCYANQFFSKLVTIDHRRHSLLVPRFTTVLNETSPRYDCPVERSV